MKRLAICVGWDFEAPTYQTGTIYKRAATVEFTIVSPILYIHYCS
jgi:hypothetical protein